MPTTNILAELPKHTRKAVQFYWQTRAGQSQKQRDAGGSDQGSRSAVTGGAQMDGFMAVLTGHAEGVLEISRGSSDQRERYPRTAVPKQPHPGGVPEPRYRRRASATLSGSSRVGNVFRGCRCAQPPASFWQPAGLLHPAPYPLELASRLVQMFSFTGDNGCTPSPPLNSQPSTINIRHSTATTMVAALQHGRNSMGVELDTDYCKLAASRLMNENSSLFGQARFQIALKPHAAVEAVVTFAETPPPFKTRAPKKPSRKRRSSLNYEN